MPPKKGSEASRLNGELLSSKELEIRSLRQRIPQLQTGAHQLVMLGQIQEADAKDLKTNLQDIIACLSSEIQIEDAKTNEFHKALEDLKVERKREVEDLTKDLNDLKSNHKFATEDLRLQLANAQVQLRDIDDFRAKKAAIDQEIAGFRDQLTKNRKEHQDVISSLERAILQEKERLKKEMVIRIEETKQQMLCQMNEQLHAKTNRTILENEQLGKELGYFIRQTELLLQKNDKLVKENIELHRRVLLVKEVEEDLTRRNYVNQKTIRMLLHELCDEHLAHKPGNVCDEKHCIKSDTHETNQIKTVDGMHINKADEAIKFLSFCLENIEKQSFKTGANEQVPSGSCLQLNPTSGSIHVTDYDFDKLSLEQLQGFLMRLLQIAMSLQGTFRNDVFCDDNSGIPLISTFSSSLESVHLGKVKDSIGCKITQGRISVGIQTESMERLA